MIKLKSLLLTLLISVLFPTIGNSLLTIIISQIIIFFIPLAPAALLISVYLSLLLTFVLTLILIKILFKEWQYVLIGVIFMFLTLQVLRFINVSNQNKFVEKFIAETEQGIAQAESTTITYKEYTEIPVLNSRKKLTSIKFRIKFVSNKDGNMYISRFLRMIGDENPNYIPPKQPKYFKFNAEEVTDKEEYGSGKYYKIEAGKEYVMEYLLEFPENNPDYAGYPLHFENRFVFGIHLSDPLKFGQGNATVIKNIVDNTSTKNYMLDENGSYVFKSNSYKVDL